MNRIQVFVSHVQEQVLVVSRMEFDLREQQNELRFILTNVILEHQSLIFEINSCSELKKTLLEDNSVGKLKAELKLAHSRTMILQQVMIISDICVCILS